MQEETSPGGSRIYRHDNPPDEDLSISGGDAELIEAVDAHLDACFGQGERMVFHEIVSPTVHVDIHLVAPTDEFPVQRLVTSGMAERPMTFPGDWDGPRYAELTIALPPDWPLEGDALDDERRYWPIRLLKELARLPHDYSTFLWYSHTIPNGDPPEPYAPDTSLCCALIAPPLVAPEQFGEFQRGDDTVKVLAVLPLYQDEMDFKLRRGADALFEHIDKAEMTDVVDPSRSSVAGRRRLFRR